MRKINDTLRKAKIFLLQENLTIVEMANRMGIHANHLNLILSTKKATSPHLAQKIEQFTKGAIKVSDLKIGDNRFKNSPKCPTCGARLKAPQA